MDDSRAASVVPLLRYRDCSRAIDWLARVFGFERHVIVGSDNGAITYAQMTLGSGMIMLGPLDGSELDSHLKQPEDIGGASTQTCYIVVDDIETHYQRAKANGAEIILDIKAGPFGSRGYSCRDLEGHIWNFGSYDPWQGKRQPVRAAPKLPAKAERKTITREVVVVSLCLSALFVTLSTVRNELLPPLQRLLDRPWSQGDAEAAAAQERRSQATIDELRRSLFDAQSALTVANLDLEKERSARAIFEQNAGKSIEEIKAQVRRELEGERAAREQSDKQALTAAEDLAQVRDAKDAAERDASELKSRLRLETLAREAAESEVRKVREQLARIEDQPRPANSDAVSTGATAPAALDAKANSNRPPYVARAASERRRAMPRRSTGKTSSDARRPEPILVPLNHPIDFEGPYMNIF